MGGEKRRAKSLRIGVHHADAVVWGPVYRTRLRKYATEHPMTPPPRMTTFGGVFDGAAWASDGAADAIATRTPPRRDDARRDDDDDDDDDGSDAPHAADAAVGRSGAGGMEVLRRARRRDDTCRNFLEVRSIQTVFHPYIGFNTLSRLLSTDR